MLESAIGTALMIMFLFAWIGFRRIVRFGFLIDIVVHATLIWAFKGTYAGMMTGVLAGLIISVFLQFLRRWYKRQPI